MKGSGAGHIKIAGSLLLVLIVWVLLINFGANLLFPLPVKKDFSKTILDSDGEIIAAYLTSDEKWRIPLKLDEVSPEFRKAIIRKEDRWFYYHFGINPVSIFNALSANLRSGEIKSGASTITMQLARMIEPRERTYWSKMIEILRAVQIEFNYSKDEILEMYLNYLPYGGNIEGVKSASIIYFDRTPDKLSLAQSITLAVIPNDPNNLRIDSDAGNTRVTRNKWIDRFFSDKTFNEPDLERASEEPLVPARHSITNKAPHFTNYLKNYTGTEIIESTLDIGLQKLAGNMLSNYARKASARGVSNGAAIIVENETMEVKAYCGSADFYDADISGQVNGITAVRSPGSTLKPILFAMAFDKGVLTPKARLLDIPTDFSGYEPDNYDLKFHGAVTAQYALMNSLNVPSVRLLEKSGFPEFISLLASNGFSSIERNRDMLGLSVILGGCGVTLEELTAFYTIFANGGKKYPLNYVALGGKGEGVPVFSAGATYLIAEILSKNERPDFPAALLGVTDLPRIAWKTGTSYGKRDAWAVGFNRKYTVGVWMGNFDGKGSPYLSGAEMAVPLLFDLFNAIDEGDTDWFEFPDDLEQVEVCGESGLPPADFCADLTHDYHLRGKTNLPRCSHMKAYYVNSAETISYCRSCLPLKDYKKKLYDSVDPELFLWQKEGGLSAAALPPPHNEECIGVSNNEGPKILSPVPEFEYYIEKGTDQRLMLLAASGASVKSHYWYINEKFHETTEPGVKVFILPSEGKNKITCIDDRGRDNSVTVYVNFF